MITVTIAPTQTVITCTVNNTASITLQSSVSGSINYVIDNTQRGIKAGGTTGQVFAKISNEDYDADWVEPSESGGAIDAASIADGSVSNAEFQRLNGVSSNIQDQIDAKQAAGNYFNKTSDDTDDITEGTKKFATQVEKDKLSNITVTQSVDLDAIETRVNDLDAAVILKGSWDASAGTFPSNAQAGWSYIVSVGGTADGETFTPKDRLICLTDNASTTVFASNWFKADYTDFITSFDGATGSLTLGGLIASYSTKDVIHDNDKFGFSDSEDANASKKTTWANIKAKIISLFSFSDTNDIDLTLTGQDITASLKATAISSKTLTVTMGSEEVLINDNGTLKKTTVQDIAGHGIVMARMAGHIMY